MLEGFLVFQMNPFQVQYIAVSALCSDIYDYLRENNVQLIICSEKRNGLSRSAITFH